MDDLFALVPPHWQTIILQAILLASIALPLLERIVSLTPSKKDDDALAIALKILQVLPRLSVPPRPSRAPLVKLEVTHPESLPASLRNTLPARPSNVERETIPPPAPTPDDLIIPTTVPVVVDPLACLQGNLKK